MNYGIATYQLTPDSPIKVKFKSQSIDGSVNEWTLLQMLTNNRQMKPIIKADFTSDKISSSFINRTMSLLLNDKVGSLELKIGVLEISHGLESWNSPKIRKFSCKVTQNSLESYQVSYGRDLISCLAS